MQIICDKLSPYDQRNTQALFWILKKTIFFCWCDFFLFHWHFVSRLYGKHNVSSWVMTLSNIQDIRWNVNPMSFLLINQNLRNFFPFKNPQLEFAVLFPYSYSVLLLSVAHLIFDLSTPRFALYQYLNLFIVFLNADFLQYCIYLLTFSLTGATQKHFVFFISIISHFKYFTSTFNTLYTKLDINPLQQILFTHISSTVKCDCTQLSQLLSNEWIISLHFKKAEIRTCLGANVCIAYFAQEILLGHFSN